MSNSNQELGISVSMTVVLGLHLDGQRSRAAGDRLGDVIVGPLGLLALLETQLGLLGDQPSPSERIVQYRDCLRKADTPGRFFHLTFATDELGTAATLLAWRDLWYLQGWNGTLGDGVGARLLDLTAVEKFARESLGPSIGERLAAVRELMERRRPAIDRVLLADPLEAFPEQWKRVLALLPIADAAEPVGSGVGFLGQLQAKLLAAAGGSREKLAWEDDGSVVAVQAETRVLAQGWVARQLHAASTLLVASSDAQGLDGALVVAGYPRFGMGEASAFRPSLQVLSLALELLWEPLNFYALVQFLTHPICPVPAFARRQLAAKVADRPGIGGQAWEVVLEAIDAHYGDDAAAVRDKIGVWVEHPRYSQEDGVPLEIVVQRVELLVEFFRLRLGDADLARRVSYNAGFSQCGACVQALRGLQAQGLAVIPPRQLQTLVAQATAHGSENPLLCAEVGAQLTVSHPAAAREAEDQVIWWQLEMPGLPPLYPWSEAEVRSLVQNGVMLPSMDAQLARAAQEWLRPVVAARKRLVLVLPPKGEEVHPLWQMIAAIVDKPVVQALEPLLTQPSDITAPVNQLAPAPRKRWWQLPADVPVPLRPKESYSSLELLLFNPYRWLLQYPARLRPSRIVSMGSEFRMLGNLAHAVVDGLYQRPDALQMTEVGFDAWFAGEFDRRVVEEGALLRMPGRGADLENFRFRLHEAVARLRRQFAKAGASQVTSEMALSGLFLGGELAGFADLVVRKSDTDWGIVDMKWSGAKKYPEKLRTNSHLQLAIYAELFRQTQGVWPSVAYFVLDRARIFAPNANFFPDAEAIAAKSGENTAQLWLRFVASWKWRKAQIEAGLIEVAAEDIEPRPELIPPVDAMAPEYLGDDYNDFWALAGWDV